MSRRAGVVQQELVLGGGCDRPVESRQGLRPTLELQIHAAQAAVGRQEGFQFIRSLARQVHHRLTSRERRLELSGLGLQFSQKEQRVDGLGGSLDGLLDGAARQGGFIPKIMVKGALQPGLCVIAPAVVGVDIQEIQGRSRHAAVVPQKWIPQQQCSAHACIARGEAGQGLL